MYSTKLLSNLFLFVGTIIILIGVGMFLLDISSEGSSHTTRHGTYVESETINGIGTSALGALLLIISLFFNFQYKKEKANKRK
jgi:hypothetical protein